MSDHILIIVMSFINSKSPILTNKRNHNHTVMNDSCSCGSGSETSNYFLLKCPKYNLIHIDLFEKVKSVLQPNDFDFDTIPFT